MKKLLFTLILLSSTLFCSEVEIAAKIIEKVSLELTKKNKVSVYTGDIRNLYIIKISEGLEREKECSNADLVLIKDKTTSQCGKKNQIVFVTDYLSFKETPHAVGAFFYQNGRPNIIFRKENLKKHNITLSEEFRKFID